MHEQFVIIYILILNCIFFPKRFKRLINLLKRLLFMKKKYKIQLIEYFTLHCISFK